MKKFLCRAALSSVLLASFLPLGFIPAYAAETQPTVTINGDPADIHAKYINNELYFSLSDFLTKQPMLIPPTSSGMRRNRFFSMDTLFFP